MSRVKSFISSLVFWLIVGIFLLLFLNPAGVLLPLAGFEPAGETAAYLERSIANQPPQCPIPWPVSSSLAISNPPQPVDYVRINYWALPPFGEIFTANELFVERLERGVNQANLPVYFAEYGETGLVSLWSNVLQNYGEPNPELLARIRNPQVELKSGAAVIYVDVDMGTRWQRVGVVLALDSKRPQFAVTGIDINGRLRRAPQSGPVADLVARLEANINDAVSQLRLEGAGSRLSVHELFIREDRLQILFGHELALPLIPQCPTDWPDTPSMTPPIAAHVVDAIRVEHWSLPAGGQTFTTGDLFAQRLEGGFTENHTPAYYLELTEVGLKQLWDNVLIQNVRPELRQRIKNAWVKLQPGTAVIFVDLTLNARQQRLGIVLAQDEDALQFHVSGLDVDGELLAPPTRGPAAELIDRVEANLNEFIRSARLVDPDGWRLPIHSVRIEEDELQVLIRD